MLPKNSLNTYRELSSRDSCNFKLCTSANNILLNWKFENPTIRLHNLYVLNMFAKFQNDQVSIIVIYWLFKSQVFVF